MERLPGAPFLQSKTPSAVKPRGSCLKQGIQKVGGNCYAYQPAYLALLW
nr:MAG TPA: hypothetical protein [Caudoviricetes sp.]